MIIPQEQFRATFKKLPYAIRDYITEDQLNQITQTIGAQYGLHVDIVGALYREATNMLLGVESPQQFMSELRNMGISQENVTAIVHELNEKVFVPLREKMKNGGDHDPYEENEQIERELYENAEAPSKPSELGTRSDTLIPETPPVPAVPTPAVNLKMKPFVPPTGTAPFPPTNAPAMPQILPATAPSAPQMPSPPSPLAMPNVAPAIPVPPPMPAAGLNSYIRTMKEDMQAVQKHEMPQMHQFSHINQGQAPQMPPHAPTPPAAAPAPAPIYSAPVSTPSSPMVPPSAPAQAQPLVAQQYTRSFPAPVRLDAHENIVRDYTHDPYREPIDDK